MKRLLAWVFLAGAIAGAERATSQAPGVVRMAALCFAIFYGMKVVVTVSEPSPLSWWRWLAFTFAWPGMRPSTFATLGGARVEGGGAILARGVLWIVVGAVAIALGHVAWARTRSTALTALLILPGISLVLHFGVLNLAVGSWRFFGVAGEPYFQAPLLARSLAEFWGKRWNRSFSEMSQVSIYRPLSERIGKGPATFVVFAFSAFLHEVVISVPARGGYGLPSLYFLVHGVLVLIERATGGRIEESRLARPWTLAWLAGPMLLLFHPPFLREVVWPLVGLGAAP